jgi:hypothetical protein
MIAERLFEVVGPPLLRVGLNGLQHTSVVRVTRYCDAANQFLDHSPSRRNASRCRDP